MADILDDLADLHRQATHEPSHYYAAKTAERAIREIERLLAALEDARRDLNGLCPRSDTGSKRKTIIENAVKRIETALNHELNGDKT